MLANGGDEEDRRNRRNQSSLPQTLKHFHRDLLAGAVMGGVVHTIVAPIERAKLRLQTQESNIAIAEEGEKLRKGNTCLIRDVSKKPKWISPMNHALRPTPTLVREQSECVCENLLMNWWSSNRPLVVYTKDAGQRPFSFQIGKGAVIKGWDEGVIGMQIGEVARLLFLDSEMRLDMVKGLLSLIVKSASGLVEKGIEQFLIRGLGDLGMFLPRDKSLYPNNKLQSDFASAFLLKIRDLGTLTKEPKWKIHRFVISSSTLVV
ncbi:hypothetical protein Bca4012_004514 [Brassica carinata]